MKCYIDHRQLAVKLFATSGATLAFLVLCQGLTILASDAKKSQHIVRLELCLCIGSYSAYSLGRWVSGRYCVGEVPRPYLSTITPYSPKPESSVVLCSPHIMIIRLVEHHYYREVIAIFMTFLANITMRRYNIFLR